MVFSPHTLHWILLGALVVALCCCSRPSGVVTSTPTQEPSWTPRRYAVDYRDTPDISHLVQADLAIVQPVLSTEQIRGLEEGGTRVVVYLSIGEAEEDDPALPELQAAGCILGQNPNWGSFYVDARCHQWQNLIIKRARDLRAAGYAGLFLDTVDTAELFPETADGIVELVRRIHQDVGGYLVQNRGFSVLDRTAPYIQAVLYEDLSAGYDFARGLYLYHEQDPAPVLPYGGTLAILALDYAPSDRPALAWRACERARSLGFVGYVAYDVNLTAGGEFCDRVSPPPAYRATPQGVFRGGDPVPLYGLNWFGLETPDRAPHGLWVGRTVADFLAQIRELGFTALRLPLSPQVLTPGHSTPDWAQSNGYPSDAYDGLLYFLEEARRTGLYVLLDFHTYDPALIGGKLPGRPYGGTYTKEDWLQDLRRMAGIALSFPNVIGVDLCNEPHKMTWADWRELALEGTAAITEVNPFILAVVEGVGNASDNGGWSAFWGENLTQAYDNPLVAPPDAGSSEADRHLFERILYLPHAYGPDVYHQPYFDAPDFPDNMPAIWDVHFGRMAGRYPLGIGEFGGFYEGEDKVWQDAFVDYLLAKEIRVFFYWALNPNSGDTGGVLLDDWRTVHEGKMALLRRLMR